MGADSPTVSVVLPTRNRAPSLGRAIDSVLSQDFRDLELIVVDDGSRDSSDALVSGLTDPRVLGIRLEHPVGAAAARNRALARASGKIIAFQDSDDVWLPGHLRSLVTALAADSDNVVAYGVVRRPPSEGRTLIPGPADVVRSGDLRRVLTRYNIVNLPSSVVRSDAVKVAGGFDEHLPRFQDWDLFLTLSTLGQFAFVDEVVTESGDAPSRITHSAEAEHVALDRIVRKHSALFALMPEHEVAQRARLVRSHVRARKASAAARQLAHIVSQPGPAVTWLRDRLRRRPSPLDRDRAGIQR